MNTGFQGPDVKARGQRRHKEPKGGGIGKSISSDGAIAG